MATYGAVHWSEERMPAREARMPRLKLAGLIVLAILFPPVGLPLLFYKVWSNRRRREYVTPIVVTPPPPRPTEQLIRQRWTPQVDQGLNLDLAQCQVEWNHPNNTSVGVTSIATLLLFRQNGTPYTIQDVDTFTCEVRLHSTRAAIPHAVEPAPIVGSTAIRVSFVTRTSGQYSVQLKFNGAVIHGRSYMREYIPAPLDPRQTVFINESRILVLTEGIYHTLTVRPRDAFGNLALIQQEHLTAELHKSSLEGAEVNPECVVDQLLNDTNYDILVKVEEEGHYIGRIKYRGETIGPPSITIICLSEPHAREVEINLAKTLFTTFKAHVVSDKGKKSRVVCYISPRQLQIRDTFLTFAFRQLYTCKVCASTEIMFLSEDGLLSIDDGFQDPITLLTPDRVVFGATFYNYVLQSIGGSEKFDQKRDYFMQELLSHHRRTARAMLDVNVARTGLLDSAMHCTRNFSNTDWCRKFKVQFHGEPGIDCGGVSREFFELLCVECFDPYKGLFVTFDESPQALVHPNPNPPPHVTLKHFEFAGKLVGKCLYETAMQNPMFVKGRFTRSFLAQIIGFKINHKYFETDDPELFKSKILFIRDHNVDEQDLELVFADEEYTPGSNTPKVVPLMKNGDRTPVLEINKLRYLNLLAEYRLSTRVKDKIEHFTKGLKSIIPTDLLSMFSENELELLMCGTSTVKFDDLKQHANVRSHLEHRRTVMEWFWASVRAFSQEEMAKLLQFTTGSSQLPVGGFQKLSPKFTILASPTHCHGRLPTASTCFNQLCLPTYDSYEMFHQSLMTAINEGSEGFGLS